jgi:hypothetical protein
MGPRPAVRPPRRTLKGARYWELAAGAGDDSSVGAPADRSCDAVASPSALPGGAVAADDLRERRRGAVREGAFDSGAPASLAPFVSGGAGVSACCPDGVAGGVSLAVALDVRAADRRRPGGGEAGAPVSAAGGVLVPLGAVSSGVSEPAVSVGDVAAPALNGGLRADLRARLTGSLRGGGAIAVLASATR